MQQYELLEKELEQWSGCDNVVACSSGTAALHLALEALQIPNPEKRSVIIPDYCMVACARAVSLAGMHPVVIDCRRDLLINPGLVESAINERTCAIMAVHNYGRLCDMRAIDELASKYDLYVIEDMAEAHGCIPYPNTDAVCWSFYKNKVIHGEEGGGISFLSGSHAETARNLRSVGFNEPHDYSHIPRGHNYRMSNAHAELIRESLKRFDIEMQQRRVIESWYDDVCPKEWKQPARISPWVYDIRIPGMSTDAQNRVVYGLREKGIQARHGFKPVSTQEEYRMVNGIWTGEAVVASREVIYLPIGLSNADTPESIQGVFKIITSLL